MAEKIVFICNWLNYNNMNSYRMLLIEQLLPVHGGKLAVTVEYIKINTNIFSCQRKITREIGRKKNNSMCNSLDSKGLLYGIGVNVTTKKRNINLKKKGASLKGAPF